MSNFTDAVDGTLRAEYEAGFHLTVGPAREVCETCDDVFPASVEEHGDEGFFSWASCESCGSKLGGQRYVAHLIAHEPEEGWPCGSKGPDVYHIHICTDCIMYHANGDEPEEWEG